MATGDKVTTVLQDFDGRELSRSISYTQPPVALLAGDGLVHQFNGDTAEALARKFEADARESGGETLRLVPATPKAARSLYSLEEHLALLIDAEETVNEDQEREYALELHATLLAVAEKRDRVGQFMAHVESQIAFAHAEVKRLQEREQFFTRVQERLESYVTRVIESLGKETSKDGKERYKKLEGKTTTLSLRGCDKRAEVTDELAVPTKYKRVTVTLPAETWELICDSLDLDLRDQVLAEVKSPALEVSTSLVKADLKAGVCVPGATLAGGFYLRRD